MLYRICDGVGVGKRLHMSMSGSYSHFQRNWLKSCFGLKAWPVDILGYILGLYGLYIGDILGLYWDS